MRRLTTTVAASLVALTTLAVPAHAERGEAVTNPVPPVHTFTTALAVWNGGITGDTVVGHSAAAAAKATFRLEGDTLVYTASVGVSNWPFVGIAGDARALRIEDSDEHITPGAGCVLPDQSDDTTVNCPMPARLRLELGDGNDHDTLDPRLPGLPISILGSTGNDVLDANNAVNNNVLLDGGDGNDLLSGMTFGDTLLGGPGNDILRGNGGNDVLQGGEGDDALEPDTMPDVVGNDLVDGGPGYDSVKDWYSTSEDPAFAVSITVDGVANDGRPGGEADNVINVINVERFDAVEPGRYVLGESDDSIDLPGFGTSMVEGRGGKDTITGNGGVETIDGGAGDDRLEGGYGHDTIVGGPGKDVIYGDETSPCPFQNGCTIVPFGNDTISARDGEADIIDCGVGNDKAVVDALDTVTNCEVVDGETTQSCKLPKKLKGLTVAKARKKLRAAGCTTIKTRKVESHSVRKGLVVGARRKGSVVTLLVSRGSGRSAGRGAA